VLKLAKYMDKYVIYARKSTEAEDRQVLSIDSQIDELNQVATRLGLNVVKIYREAQSASKLGRPVFAEMLQGVLDGKYQGILCWKPDRLARNPIDGGKIIWALKTNDLVIQTTGQLYSADSENMIMLYLEFGMAQKYTDDLSKNVKRGNLAKMKQGGWCGAAPVGYINRLDDHTVIPDPDRFHLIRKTFDLILAGTHSPEEARRTLNDDWGFRSLKRKKSGGKPLAKSSMYKLVRNPFYYGLIRRTSNDKTLEYQGSHQAMLSEEEFYRLQSIIGEPVPRPRKMSFAFSGMIHCGECGAMYSPYQKVKPSGKRYVYYRCTKKSCTVECSQKQMKEEQIDEQLLDILNTIKIPKEFADWATKWLAYLNENKTTDRKVVNKTLQETYNDVQNKINRLTDALIKDLISEDEFKTKKKQMLEERSKIKTRLDDNEGSGDNWIERVQDTLTFARSAQERFEEGDYETKRSIAVSLGAQYSLKDGKLSLQPLPVWELLSDIKPQLDKDVPICELDEFGRVKEKTTDTVSVISSWQGRKESNLREKFWRLL
jgi:site-specific DNA recombinase